MSKSDFYREVRGVMTRFDPLTELIVAEHTEDGLTYSELAGILAQYGLDIRYVVHDPNRKVFSSCYADYERGLYFDLLLNRQFFEQAGKSAIRALRTNEQGMCRDLAAKDWTAYYLKCVPLSMQIYDFQRRYRDIPEDVVFSVWYAIHKRIDFSNNMWMKEVLEYVFDRAPAPVLPEPDHNGLITIYRGMGALSQTPEQAVSWSTHPGNALWFAIHSGRGTHIAVAQIHPEQVVAYFPTFHDENEVIVRPGTVRDYRYEDMIPALQETVPPLLAPALPEFLQYGKLAQKLGYAQEQLFQVHGLLHILRVLLLSLIYCHNAGEALTVEDRQILISFSLLHDIGRTSDDRDDTHGEKSVACVREKGIRLRGIKLTKKGHRIVELLIIHHCHDDDVGTAAIMAEPGLSRREKEHIIHLYHICKDMDGLDRVRFNGLDYRMLRTEYGRKLPLIAGCLLEEDLLQALDMQLPGQM